MEEKKKGTLILDLSDPRTVDEGITALPGIKLLFRDQIAEIYEESVKDRSTIVPAVEKIIEKELPVLSARMKRLDAQYFSIFVFLKEIALLLLLNNLFHELLQYEF